MTIAGAGSKVPGGGVSSPSLRLAVLVAVPILAASVLLFLAPIPQDPSFHDFADQRHLFGIPNALDVLSNLPFLFVGVWGIALATRRARFLDAAERVTAVGLFAALAITAISSAYYHLAPDNGRLIFDRLTLSAIAPGLMWLLLIDRLRLRPGRWLTLLVLASGPLATMLWAATDDLRIYGFTQLVPVAVVILAWLMLPSRYSHSRDLAAVMAAYALSRAAERFDHELFAWMGNWVSGHTAKHLVSALAMGLFARYLARRVCQQPAENAKLAPS